MSDNRGGQVAWIKRVLGVDVPGAQPASGAIDVRAIWRDAKDEADQKINALAGKMRATNDVDLVRIADFGLFGIGGRANVALNKALIEYDGSASGRGPTGQQVRAAIEGYRAAITGNEAVKLIDNNPFGVDVALGATLGAALDRIEASLG